MVLSDCDSFHVSIWKRRRSLSSLHYTTPPTLCFSRSRGREALGQSTWSWMRQRKCLKLLRQFAAGGNNQNLVRITHTCLQERSNVSKRQAYKQEFMSLTLIGPTDSWTRFKKKSKNLMFMGLFGTLDCSQRQTFWSGVPHIIANISVYLRMEAFQMIHIRAAAYWSSFTGCHGRGPAARRFIGHILTYSSTLLMANMFSDVLDFKGKPWVSSQDVWENLQKAQVSHSETYGFLFFSDGLHNYTNSGICRLFSYFPAWQMVKVCIESLSLHTHPSHRKHVIWQLEEQNRKIGVDIVPS